MTHPRTLVVVGSGGVGKTTLAAALGVAAAGSGRDALVMTFDPSRRLKDALGVGEAARDAEVPVTFEAPGSLAASLLDARETFDRLVRRYAPDPAARDRILANRFYSHLAGSLAGVLEYMAVERLFEAASERPDRLIVLDTPPTRQALDFLEAPDRILGFLDSGALRIALKPWFDAGGRLRPAARLGRLGRGVEAFLDRMVGLDLLRDMAEFFQAFAPLYEGFRARAGEVRSLLRAAETLFVLVSGPAPEHLADTMFFAPPAGGSRPQPGSGCRQPGPPRGEKHRDRRRRPRGGRPRSRRLARGAGPAGGGAAAVAPRRAPAAGRHSPARRAAGRPPRSRRARRDTARRHRSRPCWLS